MDLKEFTKVTLIQIISGVQEANAELESTGAFVPSSNLCSCGGGKIMYANKDDIDHHVIDVDFDVAVSVSESSEKDKGSSLKIFDFATMGGTKNNFHDNTIINHVKFTIPLALPLEVNPRKNTSGTHMQRT